VYLDYNATSPVDPDVVRAMAEALADEFGNPSSVHYFGQRAKAALDDARLEVARLIDADPADLVFTSGGTESDNFALRGALDALGRSGRRRLLVSAVEHEAVLQTAKHLARRGWEVMHVPVTTEGLVTREALRECLTPDTGLVSIMHANNETGVIQPIPELASLAHDAGALFHTDAVQSVGKIPVSVSALGVDLLSLSGHKLGASKGIGALWIRRGTRLQPLLTGGRHERNRRAGTENVAAIVGLGVAARLAGRALDHEAPRLAALRDHLESRVLAEVSQTIVNGAGAPRTPNTSNISFEGVEAESLLIALDLEGIAVSTGAACSSGTLEPSHVLKAMRLPAGRAQNAIRFSLGKGSTQADVDRVADVLPSLTERLRSLMRMPAGAR
jgi:cysteine desulfurase